MSLETNAQPTPAPAESIRVPFQKPSIKFNRRRRPRRADDRTKAALADLARWFIERETQPQIVIDERMTVLLMNEPAKAFLSETDWFCISGAKLSFANDRHRAQIDRILRNEKPQAAVTLRAPTTSMALNVRRLSAEPSGTKTVLVSVVAASSTTSLQATFGLTAAESEIALSICNGLSLVSIAKQRGASINTVKTQSRHVFQKCRVHSQVTLAQKIGKLLAG